MKVEKGKKIIQGSVVEITNYGKIAEPGDDKNVGQTVKILIEKIPDEELGKLMLVEKIDLVVDVEKE